MLTLCIWKIPERLLLQTVKNQMECSMMLHFIRVYTTLKVRKIFRQKNTFCFENYKLTPLNMNNALSQIYLSNQKEETISIQRVKFVQAQSLR